MEVIIQLICLQANLQYKRHYKVYGGDINQCCKVQTNYGLVFLKLNKSAAYPAMFIREAEGLNALQHATDLKIPGVIATGVVENHQWLLLEWLEEAKPSGNFWKLFAEGLAGLHKNTNASFGWMHNNYMGSLQQVNKWCHTWQEFYGTMRLMPLVQQLYEKKLYMEKEVLAAENLCKRLSEIFPDEPAALIHGDLWSGNFMVTSGGVPSIFDPAVYYGHREMDIAITQLFGGFDKQFYSDYNNVYKLDTGWQERMPLAQLYPLLIHAMLFGNAYTVRCRNILKQFY